MNKIVLCKKCGWLLATHEEEPGKCPFCKNKREFVDVDFEEFLHWSEEETEAYVCKILPKEKYVLWDRRKLWIEEKKKKDHIQEERWRGEAERESASPVHCPYCNRGDVKKITTTGRLLSVGVFGFASGKIGKQWHCNNCGSDF